jgi:hypothetical protein
LTELSDEKMNANNIKHIAQVLEGCGKKTVERRFPDGTVLLAMPHGGRIIGLCTAENEQNIFWTHPALASHTEVKAFYAQNQWHNSGGDRTWLAPEIDIFFPKFPDSTIYTQPPQLDPGNFTIAQTEDGLLFSDKLAVTLSRSQQVVHLAATKTITPARNPLRHNDVEYAGYTTSTTLEILDSDKENRGPVGLWHLIQLPCEGRMLIPTYRKSNPLIIFGEVSEADLSASEHLCSYDASTEGSCKFSLQAIEITGRAGYTYVAEGRQTLVVRNFSVNPSGRYIDVPFNDTENTGFAFQVCKINDSQWGSFCELEYHVPAIGSGTGKSECCDVCQTWAYRGEPKKIQEIIKVLLTPSMQI